MRVKSREGLARRALALLVAAAVAVGLAVPAVYADSSFDNTRTDCSVTIHTGETNGGVALEGITVRLYRVADAAIKDGWITYTKNALFDPEKNPEWVNQDVSLTISDEWAARAKTLAGYTEKAGFDKQELAQGLVWKGETDADGNVTFDNLSVGLYLIVTETYKRGRATYTFVPSLLCLPSRDDDREWIYDWTLSPKYEKETKGNGGGDKSTPVELSVVKVWDDEGQESDRPDSVTVELLRDGVSYATQTLTKSNNWRYTWTDLSSANEWTINEVGSPNAKYTVLTEKEGSIYTVTNSHTVDIDDPDTPLAPDPGTDTPPTTIDDPDVPLSPAEPTEPAQPDTPADKLKKLPQTGQLWWPVPILAVAGILCFSAGWLRSRREEQAKASDSEEN